LLDVTITTIGFGGERAKSVDARRDIAVYSGDWGYDEGRMPRKKRNLV